MFFSTNRITIDTVFDTETCEEVSAESIINRSEDGSKELRALLAETHARNMNSARDNLPLLTSRYCCPDCGGNLRLNSLLGEKFYFTHAYKNMKCPSFERGRPSEEQVRARQYNGRKEGADHKEIKSILCQSLKCAENFIGIDEENICGTKTEPGGESQILHLVFKMKIKSAKKFLKFRCHIHLSQLYMKEKFFTETITSRFFGCLRT